MYKIKNPLTAKKEEYSGFIWMIIRGGMFYHAGVFSSEEYVLCKSYERSHAFSAISNSSVRVILKCKR